MKFEFNPDDTFLINRDGKSYTIEALDVKNIVNPEGTLITPTIDNIENEQGFPIQSDNIIRVDSIVDGVKLTLKSDINLDKIISYPERIQLSDPYIPITSGVESVSSNGNEHTYKFLPVNYDIKLFKVNDFVQLTSDTSVKGQITNIDISESSITVTSTNLVWSTIVNKTFELDIDKTDPITAVGMLQSYAIENQKVKCEVKNIAGESAEWLDQYNNRNTKPKFDTSLPRGGFEVDANGFTFNASPFDMRDKNDPTIKNTVLTLQKVVWRINGKEFDGTVTEGDVPQTFNAPLGSMYTERESTNSITVTYYSGNYRETSERYLFKSDLNPRTTTTTVDLLNRVIGFQTDLTTLGL